MRSPTKWLTTLLTLTVMAAVIAPAPDAQASSNQLDSEPPKVLNFVHEIDFGNQIDIEIEAVADFQVSEVRAIFNAVGPRNVSTYAYPSITHSETLNAQFSIDTGTSAYYPPGAEFEVRLEITALDGSVSTTESNRFLYLDPDKAWRSLSRSDIPLDFHYYGFSDRTAEALADRVEGSWRDIATSLGIEPDSVERRRAVIYPNVREASSSFPPTSDAATDGTFFGGFALDRFNVFVIGGPSADTVIHELTHLMIGQAVSSPLSPGVPSWLHEGLAQHFEAGSSRFYTDQLDGVAGDDRLLTMRTRNNVPAKSNEITLFYLQVGSFVGELIEMEGPEPMAETLRLIDGGDNASEAVASAYGKPLWELENEWRERLGASPLPAPAGSDETPQNSATPQTTSTVSPTSVGGSGVVTEPDSDGGGFDMTGPVIGVIAAAVVFGVWSFFVNRKRFRSYRRRS